jgi:seryl-tRNA synthetase
MRPRVRWSAPVRSGAELSRIRRIDARVCALARSLEATELQFPALIARDVLVHAEYPQAFPHLLMSASASPDPEAGEGPEPTAWCLSPAVCYHAYAYLAGRTVDRPSILTASGRCFRHEHETAPGVRQIEFEMREIVLVGPAGWVDRTAQSVKEKVESLARELGLSGTWRVATDPFFLPTARGKALLQQATEVKSEYQADDASRLALTSINRHGSFFGTRFRISDGAGRPVHTACIAVGLDRWSARAPDAERRSCHVPRGIDA